MKSTNFFSRQISFLNQVFFEKMVVNILLHRPVLYLFALKLDYSQEEESMIFQPSQSQNHFNHQNNSKNPLFSKYYEVTLKD